MNLIEEQKQICEKYGSTFFNTPIKLKVGISENVKDGIQPIHGLRHFPTEDASGWYIWAGEYSEDPNFFKPLHIEHLKDWNKIILPFLSLEPGFRFLVAEDGNYVDVWEDLSLISNQYID